MQTLDQIALATGTDKSSAGHDYARIYDALFVARADEPVTLVEIGVWEGASLRMWREYFTHAETRIVGVDVDLSRNLYMDAYGVELLQADAVTEAQKVAQWVGQADVVIDDGSHVAAHQAVTFGALWPRVRPGGRYCFEDVHTYWWERANPANAEAWLFDLARDAMGRGNEQPTSDIASVQFYQSLCVVQKR